MAKLRDVCAAFEIDAATARAVVAPPLWPDDRDAPWYVRSILGIAHDDTGQKSLVLTYRAAERETRLVSVARVKHFCRGEIPHRTVTAARSSGGRDKTKDDGSRKALRNALYI